MPVGAPCNVLTPPGLLYAASRALTSRAAQAEVVARGGVRNSVGFDFDPGNGELWFTDNGRD